MIELERYTWSEMVAQGILMRSGEISMSTTALINKDPHWAGNYIISLAERIKADRSIAAMK